MDPPDLESRETHALEAARLEELLPPSVEGLDRDGVGSGWLEEIVARLEEDPDERWPAIEALLELGEEVRIQVLEMLAAYRDRPGVHLLLRLLDEAPESEVSATASCGLPGDQGPSEVDRRGGDNQVGFLGTIPFPVSAALPAIEADAVGRDPRGEPDGPFARIVRSLVTGLDGDGVGMVMVSTRDCNDRRTAAFRCDVRRGILDVVGEVEKDQSSACRLVDVWVQEAEGDFVVDVPDLAVRLLGGSLALSGSHVPPVVRAWLDATIGPETVAARLHAAFPVPAIQAIPDEELEARVNLVLDACPSWPDRSALTYELAEEIALREGNTTPDPVRDAGAYRYLFEHRLMGRLELYSRMLLWMAWVWNAAGRVELSRSAFALAGHLSDEQHAVPSHPFTASLTTRSLRAAQAELRRMAPER